MKQHITNGKSLSALVVLVVIATVSTSIWLNPPSENRARTLDNVRLEDLKAIENAINLYIENHQKLPTDLNALDKEKNQLMRASWHDPETAHPFEYEVLGETSYKLCANFSRDADKGNDSYDYAFRKHNAGRDCFQLNVSTHKNP